jgi:hypothetical protein
MEAGARSREHSSKPSCAPRCRRFSVAVAAGYDCIPIVIAESWGGDLKSLGCENFIYIDKNPNQIAEVQPPLADKLDRIAGAFETIL